jgi:hypothetical protein
MTPRTEVEVRALRYNDLRALAKELGIKANAKKEVLQELCWAHILVQNLKPAANAGALGMLSVVLFLILASNTGC